MLAGQVVEFLLDQFRQFVLCVRLLPLLARLERDEEVRQFHAHRVGRHLGSAGPAPDMLHFVGEGRQHGFLHPGVVADGLIQVGPRQPRDVNADGAFRQLGRELGAEVRGDEDEGRDQDASGEGDHGKLVAHDRLQ